VRILPDGVPTGSCLRPEWPFTLWLWRLSRFCLADIEGSTVVTARVGFTQALAGRHALIRAALTARDGREMVMQGDGFFAVFSSPRACMAAMLEMQQAVAEHVWPGGEHRRTAGAALMSPAAQVGADLPADPSC
jgi:class 3 adenylate cyclase